MSTILFIVAFFAFVCGLSFLLGGSVGMLDFETPQTPRAQFLRLLDLLFTNGFFWFSQCAWKNWKTRSYERHIIVAGCACLVVSVALALIAFRLS